MTFTVRSLLDVPELQLTSLTPGVGEQRPVTWAHAYEQPDPWRWVGAGCLVMTTGIPLPSTTDEQCAYLRGMFEAGIAGLVLDTLRSPVSLTEPTLAYIAQLGFPALTSGPEVPFIAIAKAVAEALDLQTTEELYRAFGAHDIEGPIEDLLAELGRILGGSLTLQPVTGAATPSVIAHPEPGTYALPLVAPGGSELRFDTGGTVDSAQLHHVASIVGNAISIGVAAKRNERMHGSLLLADLCNASLPTAPSEHLVDAYGVEAPYLLAVWQVEDPRAGYEDAHQALATAGVPGLATIKDHQLVILAGAESGILPVFETLASADAPIGVSERFDELEALATALRQARSAAIRPHQTGHVLRFEEHTTASLFLPNDTEQLRSMWRQVLGPLRTYDEQRGTALMHTLRVFLEENRGWVRAAERLFVHRQTLVARISRIEKIIDRDLSSIEDTSESWLAVQAAIASGDLESSGRPPGGGAGGEPGAPAP
ncbi:PucR family transcriptional regulator [Leucobacter sp. USHLN153]|uniref:PucR family transcriptional regulator n=1 Tax=Leucobacter sp. USHLN153 TaxID=3081268 RepID=UPI003019F27A